MSQTKDVVGQKAADVFLRHVPAGVERTTVRALDAEKGYFEVTMSNKDGSVHSGNISLTDKSYWLNIHTAYTPKDGWSHPHERHQGHI